MFLSRSLRRELVATTLAVVAILLVYDATVVDSHRNADLAASVQDATAPTAGARMRFVTTAYCQGQTTASGVGVTTGIVAADPKLLPVGSVVELDTLPGKGTDNMPDKYRGIYTVMDTGPMITGRHVDVYLWNCNEALSYGKREAVVTVLRLGWHPKNSRPE